MYPFLVREKKLYIHKFLQAKSISPLRRLPDLTEKIIPSVGPTSLAVAVSYDGGGRRGQCVDDGAQARLHFVELFVAGVAFPLYGGGASVEPTARARLCDFLRHVG